MNVSASAFCVKLRELGGVGAPTPPARSFPQSLDVPFAPWASPGEGGGPQEQKPRHSALAVRGAVAEPRRSRCATQAPARLSCRSLGRGWSWGLSGRASGAPLCFPPGIPTPSGVSIQGLGCRVLGEKCTGSRPRVCQGQWRVMGKQELFPLQCIKGGVCLLKAQPPAWQLRGL